MQPFYIEDSYELSEQPFKVEDGAGALLRMLIRFLEEQVSASFDTVAKKDITKTLELRALESAQYLWKHAFDEECFPYHESELRIAQQVGDKKRAIRAIVSHCKLLHSFYLIHQEETMPKNLDWADELTERYSKRHIELLDELRLLDRHAFEKENLLYKEASGNYPFLADY